MQPERTASHEGFVNLIKGWWRRVTTPRATEDDQARREHMTRVVLFVLTLLVLFFTMIIVVGWLAGWFRWVDVLTMLMIAIPTLASSALALRGLWRWSTYLPPLAFLIPGLYGSIFVGLVTTLVLAYAASVVLAALLLSERASWAVVGVVLVLHLVLGWLHDRPSATGLLETALPYSGFMISIAALQHFAISRLKMALDQAHHSTRELQAEFQERTQAENQLRKLNQELYLLNRVIAAATSTLDTEAILQTILRELTQYLGIDQAGAALIHGDRKYLRVVAEYPPHSSISAIGELIPIEGNFSTQYVLEKGEALAISSAQDDPRLVPVRELMQKRHVASILILPLIVHNQVLGTIGLDSFEQRDFSPEEIALALNVASAAAQAIENARLYAEVQNLAIHDDLTQVLNRRGLFEFGRREVERARRFNRDLSTLFVDADYFKDINDRFGHATGDSVLQALAGFIRKGVREVDLVGRYGGDEFVVLLTESDLNRALEVAERLRSNIAHTAVTLGQNHIHLTISLGVAALTPQTPDLKAMIEKADQALYLAKQNGRNRVEVAG